MSSWSRARVESNGLVGCVCVCVRSMQNVTERIAGHRCLANRRTRAHKHRHTGRLRCAVGACTQNQVSMSNCRCSRVMRTPFLYNEKTRDCKHVRMHDTHTNTHVRSLPHTRSFGMRCCDWMTVQNAADNWRVSISSSSSSSD